MDPLLSTSSPASRTGQMIVSGGHPNRPSNTCGYLEDAIAPSLTELGQIMCTQRSRPSLALVFGQNGPGRCVRLSRHSHPRLCHCCVVLIVLEYCTDINASGGFAEVQAQALSIHSFGPQLLLDPVQGSICQCDCHGKETKRVQMQGMYPTVPCGRTLIPQKVLIESWAPVIKLKAKVAKWPKQYLATTKRLWQHCGGHLPATSHCAIVLRALCPQQYKRSWQ